MWHCVMEGHALVAGPGDEACALLHQAHPWFKREDPEVDLEALNGGVRAHGAVAPD